MNFLHFDGAVKAGAKSAKLNDHTFAIPEQREATSGELVLGVRPEHVSLSDKAKYRGEVVATEYLGTTQIITLNTGHGSVKARASSAQIAKVGETVGLEFNPRTLTLFDKTSGNALKSALNEGSFNNG